MIVKFKWSILFLIFTFISLSFINHLLAAVIERHYMASCPYSGCENPAPTQKSSFNNTDCILNYNYVSGCNIGDTSHMIWNAPDGSSFTATNRPIDRACGWCLYTWWRACTIPKIYGEWSVDFYYNDQKKYTDTFQLTSSPCCEEGWLCYDDGSIESSNSPWTDETGNEIAIRFTPESYPVTVKSVKYFVSGYREPTTTFGVRLYDDNNGVLPGSRLDSGNITAVAEAGNTWVTVDLTSENIKVDEGDFFVSMCWLTAPGIDGTHAQYLGRDTDPPVHANPIWKKYGQWYSYEYADGHGNMMIRAELECSPTVIGNGVNIQPSYYCGGDLDIGWDLMKTNPNIKTVRIEMDPGGYGTDINDFKRWIGEANENCFQVIATYHDCDKLGSSTKGDLVYAATWWANNYYDLSSAGPFTINLMNEWGDHSVSPQQYADAYNDAIEVIRTPDLDKSYPGYSGTIICDIPGWGQATHVAADAYNAKLINDDNIIFSVHIYPTAWNQRNRTWMQTSDLDFLGAAGIPVIVGEFGSKPESCGDGTTCGADWGELVDHARSKGWPVLGWAWNGEHENPTMNMIAPYWTDCNKDNSCKNSCNCDRYYLTDYYYDISKKLAKYESVSEDFNELQENELITLLTLSGGVELNAAGNVVVKLVNGLLGLFIGSDTRSLSTDKLLRMAGTNTITIDFPAYVTSVTLNLADYGGNTTIFVYGENTELLETMLINGDTPQFYTISDVGNIYQVVIVSDSGWLGSVGYSFGGTIIYVNSDGYCNGENLCYATISEGYTASQNGAIIKTSAGDYVENLVLDISKSITINGGWENDYTTQFSDSTLLGSMTISSGCLTIENLAIGGQ